MRRGWIGNDSGQGEGGEGRVWGSVAGMGEAGFPGQFWDSNVLHLGGNLSKI